MKTKNVMVVIGEKKYLKQIRDEIVSIDKNGKEYLDCDRILPMPSELNCKCRNSIGLMPCFWMHNYSDITKLLMAVIVISREYKGITGIIENANIDVESAEKGISVAYENLQQKIKEAKEQPNPSNIIHTYKEQLTIEEALNIFEEEKNGLLNLVKYGCATHSEWETIMNFSDSLVSDIKKSKNASEIKDKKCKSYFKVSFVSRGYAPFPFIKAIAKKYPEAKIVGAFTPFRKSNGFYNSNPSFYSNTDAIANGIESFTEFWMNRIRKIGDFTLVTLDSSHCKDYFDNRYEYQYAAAIWKNIFHVTLVNKEQQEETVIC